MASIGKLSDSECDGNFNFKKFLDTINEDEFIKANL